MGDVASFSEYANGAIPEAELRKIARKMYASNKVRHFSRIAQVVGRPIEDIKRWKDEENWVLARAATIKEKEDSRLAEIATLLKSANLKDSRQAALDTLKNCDDASGLVRGCLDRLKSTGTTLDYLDKLLASQERLEKIRKDAYARL